MNLQTRVLVGAVFLDMVGFGMLIPGVQLRLETMGAASWLIGLIQSSTFAVQTLVSPRWGRLGDRTGRKAILVACTGLSAGSMALYALAPGILWIAASRIVAGLGGANVSAAQALASGDETERSANLARIGAAVSGGLVLGPALGGVLGKAFGDHWVGWVACAASTLGAVLAATLLPKDVPVQDQEGPTKKGSLLRDVPAVRPLVMVAAVAWFSLACLEGTFGRLIRAQHGYGEYEFGLLFAFESLVAIGIQGFALKPLVQRWGDWPLATLGFLLQGLGLGLTPLAPHLGALFGTSLIYAAGSSSSNPTIQSRASAVVSQDRQGELFGVLQSARSVGFLVGPTVGGIMFGLQPSLPYFLSGGVCTLAALMTWRLSRVKT